METDSDSKTESESDPTETTRMQANNEENKVIFPNQCDVNETDCSRSRNPYSGQVLLSKTKTNK